RNASRQDQPAPTEQRTSLLWRDESWPRDRAALCQLLGNPNLAWQLEQPLATDVDCGQPPAIWHLMAALEFRKRGYDAHPLAIRAVLTCNGCNVLLTREAIEPVLAIVSQSLR